MSPPITNPEHEVNKMSSKMMKSWMVCEWGSHPHEDNDDCWTGEDFATLDEAKRAFEAITGSYETAYFTLQLEEKKPESRWPLTTFLKVRKNPSFDAEKVKLDRDDDDRSWRREQAMEAGMLGGCDAYNDFMGY